MLYYIHIFIWPMSTFSLVSFLLAKLEVDETRAPLRGILKIKLAKKQYVNLKEFSH